MRWPIIRLIWMRELRDQLRDRRTVFMMAVLPILLYPLMGAGLMQFAALSLDKPSVIGIYTGPGLSKSFPPREPPGAGFSPIPVTTWFSLASSSGLDQLLGSAGLVHASEQCFDYPCLVNDGHLEPAESSNLLGLEPRIIVEFLPSADRTPLDDKKVDLILTAGPGFWTQLEADERPEIHILGREGDDLSRQARRRLKAIFDQWNGQVKEVRFHRHGLPANFDRPIVFKFPEPSRTSFAAAADDFFGLLVRVFPFVLVMWSLAGALYPAVDICAGEKERGTMETLLISPASRKEIVWGKFLTIWVFSAATALLNLVSMGGTTALLGSVLPHAILRPAAMVWCVLLVLPLSAFFSALCLAVGAYARSSKEGQHYLMPLFLITMPLVLLTMAPGVELNPLYSLVPVTGVALLLQRLIAATTLDQVPWFYFLPVLAPMLLYSWLALRWAIDQFQREEVLFREAERLDIRLWLKHMFRDKDPLPTSGQAFFCFAVIMLLQWLSMGFGSQLPVSVHTSIRLLAFVGAPALLMTLLLTRKPRFSLALIWPSPKAWGLGVVLGILLLPPLVELTSTVLTLIRDFKGSPVQLSPLAEAFRAIAEEPDSTTRWRYYLTLAVLPALCWELTFRGFILTGLRSRFRPWTAILLSSFLFALSQLNVFEFLPSFLLGMVLAILAVRSASVLPGIIFHIVHNSLILAPALLFGTTEHEHLPIVPPQLRVPIALLCAMVAVPILWRLASRIWTVDTAVNDEPLPEMRTEERSVEMTTR